MNAAKRIRAKVKTRIVEYHFKQLWICWNQRILHLGNIWSRRPFHSLPRTTEKQCPNFSIRQIFSCVVWKHTHTHTHINILLIIHHNSGPRSWPTKTFCQEINWNLYRLHARCYTRVRYFFIFSFSTFSTSSITADIGSAEFSVQHLQSKFCLIIIKKPTHFIMLVFLFWCSVLY